MADKRISELVNADALSGVESVEVVQGGVNKKTTAQDIANLAPGAGHVIEDEGTPLTARTKLNFVGAGVTVTDDAGDDATVVTIDSTGAVASVSGDGVDNTDPANPVISYPTPGDISAANAAHTHAISDVTNLQTELDAKLDNTVTFNRQTASYTLVLADATKMVEMNNASANDLTVPPNSSVAFPVGTQLLISQYGGGQTTIVEGSGVIIRSSSGLKLRTQFSQATLIKVGTDEWYLGGDITI